MAKILPDSEICVVYCGVLVVQVGQPGPNGFLRVGSQGWGGLLFWGEHIA